MPRPEVARFYTRSRRFPKMIGRMTDGSRIPGGPYTMTQAGFGGATLLVLLLTRTLWTTGLVLVDIVIVAGATWAVTWLAGSLPTTHRSLTLALVSAIAAMFKPHAGRYQGRPVKLNRPHRVGGAARVAQQVIDEPSSRPDEDVVLKPIKASAPVPVDLVQPPRPASERTAMSSVERLLQRANNN